MKLLMMKKLILPLIAAAAIRGAASQLVDCDTPEPCLENYLTQLTPLLSGGNDTLFASANEPCGGDAFAVISQTVVAGCLADIETPPGCECGASCKASANTILPACREAIIDTYCENAVWIEADLQVNLRSIFLHLLNDCNDGTPVDCPATVPDFDPSVCAAPGPGPSAAAPGSAGAPLQDTGTDDSAFVFRPISAGGSLGELNAADAQAPAPVPAAVTNPESSGAVALTASTAVAVVMGAALLL
eukprot:jgi/Ulvmu1/4496/UM002_0222.1